MQFFRLWALIFMFLSPFFAYTEHIFKIGMTQFPTTLHPHFSPMIAKNFILGMALRPITSFNSDWELRCLSCKTLPQLNSEQIKLIDSEKQLYEITYHLKDNLYWGDGTQVTVSDIIFTWEMGKNPQNGFINHVLYRDEILDIQQVDRFTFKMIRKKSELPLNDLNDFWIMPKHMEAQFLGLTDQSYRDHSLYYQNVNNPGLYFGPYIVKYYEQGRSVVLKKNPFWKGETLYFDEIHIFGFKNGFTLEAALLTGEIDMTGVPGLSIENIQNLKTQQKFDQLYKVLDRSTLTLELLMPNFDNQFLKHQKIRQGLLKALDRTEITKLIFGEYAEVASGFFNPLDPLFISPNISLTYDPSASVKLFEASGLTFDPIKNLWRNSEGEIFQLNVITTAGNGVRKKYLDYCKDRWEKLGIKISLQFVPPRVFFGDVLKHRNFSGLALVGWPTTPGFIPINTFESDMIPSSENAYIGYNYMGYKSEEMDAILDHFSHSIDPKKDKKTILDFQNLVNEDLPLMPLYYKDRFYIVPKLLEGLKPTGHLFPASFWIEEWQFSDP